MLKLLAVASWIPVLTGGVLAALATSGFQKLGVSLWGFGVGAQVVLGGVFVLGALSRSAQHSLNAGIGSQANFRRDNSVRWSTRRSVVIAIAILILVIVATALPIDFLGTAKADLKISVDQIRVGDQTKLTCLIVVENTGDVIIRKFFVKAQKPIDSQDVTLSVGPYRLAERQTGDQMEFLIEGIVAPRVSMTISWNADSCPVVTEVGYVIINADVDTGGAGEAEFVPQGRKESQREN